MAKPLPPTLSYNPSSKRYNPDLLHDDLLSSYKPSQFEQAGDVAHLLEVRLPQEIVQFLLQMPQLQRVSVGGASGYFSEVDMEEVLGDVYEFVDLEGNVAPGFVFDLAALAQRIEGVLFSASAFEPVCVVLCHLLLQKREQTVGGGCDHVLLQAVHAVCCQLSLVGRGHALSATAHDLAQ